MFKGSGSGLLKENFSELEINKVSDEYLRGLQWVMTYYKKGMPDWEWYYPEFYAPFLCDLAKTASKSEQIREQMVFTLHEPIFTLYAIIVCNSAA